MIEYVTLAHAAAIDAAIRGAQINRSAGLKTWADLTKRAIVKKHHDGEWFCA